VNGLLMLVAILTLATCYGTWVKVSRSRIKQVSVVGRSPLASAIKAQFNVLGSKATLVQFSSAFCAPCRATKALLSDIAAKSTGVVHIEIDAESQLALVRELSIRSTPTTLILDGQGREVGRAVGAPKRDQVLSALAAIQ